MSGPFTIRMTNYAGDMDDLHEVNVIGPYDTAEQRDADLARLDKLPGNNGDAEFEPSRLNPEGADRRATPAQVAGVTNLSELFDVL